MGSTPDYAVSEAGLRRFATRLHEAIGAQRVLLFGSRAQGRAAPDSDYDFIIVADHFRNVNPLERSLGIRQTFYEAAGHAPMDLICLTPEEFEEASRRITLVAAVLPEAIDLLPAAAPSR